MGRGGDRKDRGRGCQLIGEKGFLTLVVSDGCLKTYHFEASLVLLSPSNEINLFLFFFLLKGQKALIFPSGIPLLWIGMSVSNFQERPKPSILFVS